ncbi:hypothetical protein CEUSTIGMA_g2495.t1 [Chlamydomonas eustigma]|uniref:Exonuclease domain-containing protein n=1 Tax=Chlamydomonas eustigma TaxID=1157962 RepID=A0A250WW57_9CHLO|nr:hypothetical protein CEUSTIGMA_g2495.t1 [Chlamydomonas eustigma]|eukprot:GAX75051.1 hypothetical protein CEUSTIGMA_g2495.t1 [Chlamydomonas eustigma]
MFSSQYPWAEYGAAAPLNTYGSGISVIKFDEQHELLWSGTEYGRLINTHSPSLETYARWQAHPDGYPVLDLLPLQGCCLSLSSSQASLSVAGGASRFTYKHEAGSLVSCCWEPGQANSRALLSSSTAGTILSLDLASGKAWNLPGEINSEDQFSFLRGPTGRGFVVAGLASGSVSLLDVRSKFKVESNIAAHTGGLAHMDVKSDTLATCGYWLRGGQLVVDSFVKVWDLRFNIKPIVSLPCGSGTCCLAFHPSFSSTLAIVSMAGSFSFADVGVGSVVQSYQVDTGGDALTCCTMSSTGEMLALGASGGFLHLWTDQEEPRVNYNSDYLETPSPVPSPPEVLLQDSEPFSYAPLPHLASGKYYLSDLAPGSRMKVGLPPRVVPESLLEGIKQVDFVGHVLNPSFSRSKGPGEASKLVASLRNQRVQVVSDTKSGATEDRKAERMKKRLEQGGVLLPSHYHKIEIRQQSGARFEEFDFTYYNRTKFAGLENGIANCYCNALLQALYFIPQFRSLMLAHKPEPDIEFCLTCEMHFLFCMLKTGQGTPCQASNLLSALRQVRETSALGLLDGVLVPPGVVLPETQGPKAWALSRRLASLSRFLLEHMYSMCKELSTSNQMQQQSGMSSSAASTGLADTSSATSSSGHTGTRLPPGPPRSGIKQPDPENLKLASKLEDLVGMRYKQRMVCLSGSHVGAEKIREARCFQIDLQYPIKQPASPTAPGSITASNTSSMKASSPVASPTALMSSKDGGGEGAFAFDKSNATFSDILQSSLQAVHTTRAWFDEKRSYQVVRQSRMPFQLPKVLAINCSPSELSDVAWWSTPQKDSKDAPKLPWALAITMRPFTWHLEVQEAGSVKELWEMRGSGNCGVSGEGCETVYYELSGVISHIRDADDLPETFEDVIKVSTNTNQSSGKSGGNTSAARDEGHLVSCIKVPQQYWEEAGAESGPLHSSRASADPFSMKGLVSPHLLAPSGQVEYNTPAGSGAGRRLTTSESLAALPSFLDLPESLDDVLLGVSFQTSSIGQDSNVTGQRITGQEADDRLVTEVSETCPTFSSQGSAIKQESASAAMTTPWLLINDFSLSMCPAPEVCNVYGGQKLPCLIFYTKVETEPVLEKEDMDASAEVRQKTEPVGAAPSDALGATLKGQEVLAGPARPVLTPDQYQCLCSALPLQGPQVHLLPKRFRPLNMLTEAPKPGFIVAIDSEFVALTPAADKTAALDGSVAASDGLLIKRQTRLCLARVSVVRGEGPQAGEPFMDDHVRMVEPVFDYLTRFSGLVKGDLDVLTSRHYLTTLKHVYLKLRYLADCGCVFVGHGMKKDFRMINLILPASQQIDTAELFSLRRQRKLSLRFLASYLLGINIQGGTHDAIEDARTALWLYQKYMQLQREGTFEQKLAEMYRWGNHHGWEPVSLGVDGQPRRRVVNQQALC